MNMRTNEHGMLLLGIGNRFRRDDAAGLIVADKVAERLAALPDPADAIAVRRCAPDAASILSAFHGFALVVLADAILRPPNVPVGSVCRFDATAGPLPADLATVSTHGFSIAAAIELARTLQQLPETVVLFGIAADDFAMGENPGAAVLSGCTEAADLILDLLLHRATVKPDFTGEWYHA